MSANWVTSVNPGWAVRVFDGSTNNGYHNLYHNLTTAGAYIYDATGTLQQSVNQPNIVADSLVGSVLVFDSQETVEGARRARGSSFCGSYSGPWGTYTTDNGVNWTAKGGTNLYLGSWSGSTNNGLTETIYIYNRR